MSLKHIEEAIEKVALSRAVQSTIVPGTIGAIVGAARKKDEGESRLHSIARSAGTGAAIGLGSNIAARGANRLIKFDPHKAELARAIADKKLMGKHAIKGLAVIGAGTAGGIGAYHLAKRKEKK